MKDKKSLIILICFCLIAVLALFAWHNRTRAVVQDGCISIEGKEAVILNLNDISLKTLSGQTYNKKGELKEISGEGVDLGELIAQYASDDYEEVTVISDDEYKAVILKEELGISNNAVLLIEDSLARLYVFNDIYSSRNVSNVKRIILN